MSLLIATLCLLLAGGADAQYGPHANAVFVPHLQPELEYSFGQSYEYNCNLRDCEDAIVSGAVPTEEDAAARIFYVVASLVDCPGPIEVGALQFGFESYDTGAFSIVDYRLIDQQLFLATDGWPGPNEGIALTYTPPRRERIFPIAWFAAYVYATVSVPLGPDPAYAPEVAAITTRKEPPQTDVLEDYMLGVLAFNEAGYNPCAGSPNITGACCLGSRCQELTRIDCEIQAGVFHGENTQCFPNPCQPPRATTWGRVKLTYQH